jgi:hypothetical protein
MSAPKTLLEDLNFRTVKIFDIGYIAILYFVIGLIVSRLFDKILGEFNQKKDDEKHIAQVTVELFGMIWMVGATTYIVRNLVELIPSPFDGLAGLVHKKVKEIASAGVFTLIVMGYAYHFRAKLDYFNRRLNRALNVPIPNIFLTPKSPEQQRGVATGVDGSALPDSPLQKMNQQLPVRK